jgi:outer membrane lipoprotein-sorting protein
MNRLRQFPAAILIAAMLVFMSIIGSACSGDNGPTTFPTSPTSNPDNLPTVLSRTADLNSVTYDVITALPNHSQTTSRVWLIKDQVKIESEIDGETKTAFIDYQAETYHVFTEGDRYAIKYAFDLDALGLSLLDKTLNISNYNATTTGSETLEGKECLVVEYNQDNTPVKTWLWKETGFPLRSEITQAGGTTVVEYKNVSFDLPDTSAVSLPANMMVIDLSKEYNTPDYPF